MKKNSIEKIFSPVFIFRNPIAGKYVVMTSKYWDWKDTNTRWMDDNDVGQKAQIPQIGIVDESFVFDNPLGAFKKIMKIYIMRFYDYIMCKSEETMDEEETMDKESLSSKKKKESTVVLMSKISQAYGRKEMEELEGTSFTINELRELCENNNLVYYSLSAFMNICNEDEFDVDNNWVAFVKLKH